MDYTIKNLREVDDAAAGREGLSDVQEARFAMGALEASDTGLAFHVIRPGKRQLFGHRHNKAEEVYVVLAGGGRVRLDEETVEISRLDAIRCAPAVARGFEAGPDGMELLVFGPHHSGDGEILQEFWKE